MCGLVGAAGALTLKDDTSIFRLLMLDYLRGKDATGLAAVGSQGNIKLAKLANDPITLSQSEHFKSALCGVNRVFIGHNRAATRGEKSNYNAHPFICGDIVGAHNGTLDQQSWHRLEEALGVKYNVDSHALIAAIDKLGPEAAIELCEEGRGPETGAWSLVWYNQIEGSLNFLRNKHRPMWLAYAKDFKRMYWSSEWWQLEAIGTADGIEFHKEGEKGYRFFPTDENVHLKFDVGLLITATEAVKPKIKKIAGREPLPVVTYTKADDPFGRESNVIGFHVPKQNSPSVSHGTKSKTLLSHNSSDNVIHWMGNAAHPYAGYINEANFEQYAKYGCAWCGATVDYGTLGLTIFDEAQDLLCPKCSGTHPVHQDTPVRIYVSQSNYALMRA